MVGNSQSYSFTLPNITDESGRIRVVFTANSTTGSTTMTAAIDGKNIATQTISGLDPNSVDAHYIKASEATLDQLWSGEKSESTVVKLTHNRASGISGRLNYIILNYKQRLQM
ncbi:MAG: hypothetical protein ACLS4S_07925, partial [Bacteroides nordii]